MSKNNLAIAEAYYRSLGEKDMAKIEKVLAPDVHLIGPLQELMGKEAILTATMHFVEMIKALTIRAKFSSGDQTMIIYDAVFPEPMGKVRGASLMTFRDELVEKIELFYDSHLVTSVKDEIFS